MSLYTGKRLNSYVWEELPVSDEIIERLEEIAQQQQQPELVIRVPSFEWISTHGGSQEQDKEKAEIEEVKIEQAQIEEVDIEEADIEELKDNNRVTDDEKSLQTNQIQEYDEDAQSTNTDIKQRQEIEITIGETNIRIQENEDNLMTIGEYTDTEDSLKTMESELFREAENNNDWGSITQDGVQRSAQLQYIVPSRLNSAGITGKYTQVVQFLAQK